MMFLRTSGGFGRMESPQTFGSRAFSAAARAYVLSSGKPEDKRGGQLSLSGMGTPVRAGRAPTPGVGGVRTHVVRERKHSQKVLPERARAKPASAWRYGSGCTKDTATARTVCLLAGRRLGKGSECPAGQAAKRFEVRLLLLSKASAPLRRRANSSR
ncbi:hypothetical protein PUN4_280158 [Paraburkholderia unamae]|nr:hypothetical protein PUN4_280158 [Paraburkholderia unamae]